MIKADNKQTEISGNSLEIMVQFYRIVREMATIMRDHGGEQGLRALDELYEIGRKRANESTSRR